MLFRLIGIALTGALLGLVLKRNVPELALSLGLATVCALLFCVADLFAGIADFIRTLSSLASLPPGVLMPMFKTAGVAAVTRLTSEACHDAGERAVAAAVELAGSLLSLTVAIPLFMELIELMKNLL